jgi:ATP-dependent helicase HepA
MIGYIIKHSHLGIGKVISQQSNIFHIKFITGQTLPFGSGAFSSGVITHGRLEIGNRCLGKNGECKITRIEQESRNDSPYQYQVAYDDGLSAVVSELDLIPLSTEEEKEPLLQLASLSPQSYTIFKTRERLVESLSRTLREGSGLQALLSSRIDLRPHQAFVAGVVILDPSRRYLLADEVGLGKTIEAGIVIHDLLTHNPNARILILCPGALTQQWLSEMYAKFCGQIFSLLDLYKGQQLKWHNVQKAIVSTTHAAYDISDEISSVKWDMVIVDEAHHLLASPVLYNFVQLLSVGASSLLLLSAIPAQRRETDFLRLLSLLEPRRYRIETNSLKHFRTLYEAQEDIGRRLRRTSRRLSDVESGDAAPDDALNMTRRLLELPLLSDDDKLNSMIDALDAQSNTFAEDVHSILHYVADNYRINRRILRNRRQRLIEEGQLQPIIRKFVPHPYRPEQLEIETADAFDSIIRGLHKDDAAFDLATPFARVALQSLVSPTSALELAQRLADAENEMLNERGKDFLAMGYIFGYEDWDDYCDLLCMGVRRFIPESLIDHALDRASAWQQSTRSMARLKELVKLLDSKRGSSRLPKILIFAGFPGVAGELAESLRSEFGNDAVKEFRYDMKQEEKEQNVRRFQVHPAAWLLVSDETGGEGRNFQFADELIHFDNPWYAARVEQRIGRLDRLGRDKFHMEVISHVFYNEGTVEAGLVRCYHEGLRVYDRSISGLEFALKDVEQSIIDVALQSGYDGLLDFAPELNKKAEQERAQNESEAVLDEASFELKTAKRFHKVSQAQHIESELESAFINYFRHISTEKSVKDVYEQGFAQGIWRFKADNVRYGRLPGLHTNQSGSLDEYKGTFRREIAQQRPELNFFSIGNQLFDSVVKSLTEYPTGRTYAVACSIPIRRPWIGFEFVFTAQPDSDILGNNYGLVNQAKSLFNAGPLHLFYSSEGSYADDQSELLQVRQSLADDKRNQNWWNLTKERSQLLSQSVGKQDWQHVVLQLHEVAKIKARQIMHERLDEKLKAEANRIREAVRQAQRQDEQTAQVDMKALQLLAVSLARWSIQLDGVGFLSINELTFPR